MTTTTYYSARTVLTDPLALAHRARVLAAGGQGLNETYLAAVVTWLRRHQLDEANILHLSDVRLGYLADAGGAVRQLFCLGGHDALPVEGQALPQLVGQGLAGRPELQYHDAALAVPDFTLAPHPRYALLMLLRQENSSGFMLEYEGGYASRMGIYPLYGYLRCGHAVYYTGQELVFNDGTGYDGGWVNLAARYNFDRGEAQLTGNFYAWRTRQRHAMGYAYNNARGPMPGPAPLYLGRGAQHAACIGLALLRECDDEAALAELSQLLQSGYDA